MAPSLVACPDCHHHTRARALACDHCGSFLRKEGSVPQTAAALALGLSLAASACGEEVTPVYGIVAVSSSSSSTATGGAGGTAGGGGAGAMGGDGGAEATPDYGVPGVGGGGGG